MSHTIRKKQRLVARVRRIRGQMEAIERALDSESGCEHVMHQLTSARAAMSGLMAEVVEEHVRTHLVDANMHPSALSEVGVEQLMTVINSYLR